MKLSPLIVLLCVASSSLAGRLQAEERLEMADPATVLHTFMKRLATGQLEKAYVLVAPSSKKNGDPIANRAPLDFASFRREVEAMRNDIADEIPFPKFSGYRTSTQRRPAPDLVRITIHMGGDNDETMIVRENGRWYVADPLHIIR